ncbi:hypothetical protein HOE04_00375 [archaeon]|jgi:hypothetical protein|nr:hypothetical protein [archaeon]
MDDGASSKERSFKEQRVREVSFIYYMRGDIKKAIYDFSLKRECVPRYFEGFGKRPDSFQYEGDVLEQVKRGATSFHCSEELWDDVLEINNEMSRDEFNELRCGWDLLLDIDSPYLEYSKIYAEILISVLKFHGIDNVGVKFSGSKGFHVIVPWGAFPEEIYGKKTKDMFPEWPRLICEYLGSIIQPKLADKILHDDSLKEIAKKTGREESELVVRECVSCHRPAVKKNLIHWICPACKNEIDAEEGMYNNRRKSKCPNPECRTELFEASREEMHYCKYCEVNSKRNPEMFEEKERFDTDKLIEADLILVSPRHLFRMPYSLHEKTALSSVVIDKDKIKDFQITDARPLKVKVDEFYVDVRKDEGKELLLQALDWKEQKDRYERIVEDMKKGADKLEGVGNKPKHSGEFKQIIIPEPPEEIFPPQIKLILNGLKHDGRKRALFVLLSFFKSLGAKDEWIEKKVFEWNEKNYHPLKKGYLLGQLNWYRKGPLRLPPNFGNDIYQELGVDEIDELVRQTKNPVSYAVKKWFQLGMGR